MKLLTYEPTKRVIGIGVPRTVWVGDSGYVSQRVIGKLCLPSVGAVDSKNVAFEVVLKFGGFTVGGDELEVARLVVLVLCLRTLSVNGGDYSTCLIVCIACTVCLDDAAKSIILYIRLVFQCICIFMTSPPASYS